ncbi:unnamed protein product [Parnassius mnemosyne]|uniref:DUF2428 domain-containing protein n=1 Tax=Parnassius mnemosyne TaxID=213953 RepID=A0AAV1KIA4_9NEOP
MEDLLGIISLLEVPTALLKSDVLQEVLIKIKKINIQTERTDDYLLLYDKLLQALWGHLQSELRELDDQLLCSTCFYIILSNVEKQEHFLKLVLQNINEELNKRNEPNKENSTIMRTISIIYGMFQSSFLSQKDKENEAVLEDILNSVFNLLIQMAYEYSHYTFITFKIIVLLKKVCGTSLQDIVFTKQNQLKLLNVVNHNWENPINGIRNLNRSVFQTIISVMDVDIYEEIFREINSFCWNKAKYLMLSEIIEQYTDNVVILMKRFNLVDGLLHSLHKPGLVSAGADMYYSLLKKINSHEEWSELFLNSIIQILNCTSQKAIENLNNYWCLTTLKKFPTLSTLIINELQKCENLEKKMFGTLCLIRQSNKLNLIVKDWSQMTDIEQLVICGIEHCNPYIRMSAFDIVCVTHGNSWPSKKEYTIVLNFLADNVNSDCTVLRLFMLNSFNSFLERLQAMFMNNRNMDQNVDNLVAFCTKLQEFLITSLNLNGNYQRKITTIKIVLTIFNCFTVIPKKRQKQMKQTNYTLIRLLTDGNNCVLFSEKVVENLIRLLSDPADDIRENVIHLLLHHYNKELKKLIIMNHIINTALLNIKSKFFYEINCGQSMFKLITNVLLKEHNLESVLFRNIDEIFNFAYTMLKTEYKLNRDIMESIKEGKQLHSNISVLCVIFEACLKDSYKLQIEKDTIWTLLEILESTSSQFVWEKGITTSSDFSKMNDMVQHIIEKSGYTTINNEDETKITGLQQIVLNCLWLNVKASCQLASLILKYHNSDMHLAICEKSLHVITKVLETSRHKGAIEAAGVALGEAIQNLTSLPSEYQLSELPLSLLKQKLNELLLEANNMASVTRRGAGLSIMVHSIVSNDKKKNKPLFHYFVNTLLETCKVIQDDSIYFENISNVNNEKDLPKAIYIHFLTRIVTDSSLTTEVMYYSAKLAELAFDNLTSSHWQIRNAALQLYGALIPKLIGQKKASGSEDEVAATVACDEFRTHFPQLWRFILAQLKGDQKKDVLQSHSNFLPILNILGNLAIRYNFFNNFENEIDADGLLNSLVVLLGSPIFTVRRITANSIFNMYSFDNIFEILEKVKQVNENYLHGYLLLLVKCYNHYKNTTYQSKLDILKIKFRTILGSQMHSYLCRELLENICNETYNLVEILSEIKNHSNEPGKFQWANTHIRKCLLNCEWAEIPHWLSLILDSSEYEKHCEILCSKIDSQRDVDSVVLIKITHILLAFPKKMSSSIIWEILYKISLITNLDNNIDIKDITKYLKDNISYKLRYIIPFVARITFEEDILLALSKIIHKLCNAEESDIEMRIIAAKANNEIAHKLMKLPDDIKTVSIITAVILLQDENEDVRNLSVYFYKNFCKTSSLVHPYICLRSILDSAFLSTFFSDPSRGINSISDGLLNSLQSLTSHNMDTFNPFTNESKNIYQEVTVIQYLIANLKKGS